MEFSSLDITYNTPLCCPSHLRLVLDGRTMNSPSLSYAVEFFADVMDQKGVQDRFASSDLELAAEIGQNLLDRNKELEVLLKASQQYLEEQGKENEFLSKQLQAMRDINDGRVKAYEQLEASALELHQTNERLQTETTTMKKHWQHLSETIESLENKCEDYRKEIDELQADRVRLQREMAESFSSDGEAKDRKWSCSGEESSETEDQREKEMQSLNERIANLKAQHDLERMHRQELECELSELIGENQQLELQLRGFAQQAEKWQQEIRLIKSIDDKSSESRGRNRDSTEIDLDDSSYVLVKSRPSSTMSDQSGIEVLSSPDETSSPKKTGVGLGVSFLSELDSQYHELSRKYDALLEKCQGEGKSNNSSRVQTVQRAIQAPPVNEIETQKGSDFEFDCRPPRRRATSDTTSMATSYKTGDYKKMFAAIYEKLSETKNFKPLGQPS